MSKEFIFTNGILTNVINANGSPIGVRRYTFTNGILTNVGDFIPGAIRNHQTFNFINGFLTGSSGSILPPSSDCTKLTAPSTGPFALATSGCVVTSGSRVLTTIETNYHCKIRDGNADNPTMLLVSGTNYNSSGSAAGYAPASGSNVLVVSAYDQSGTDILYGTEQNSSGSPYGDRQYLFSPDHPTEVWGFRFNAGNISGSAYSFAKAEIISSGSVPLTRTGEIDILPYMSDPNQMFYLESSGGPITEHYTLANENHIDYQIQTVIYYGGFLTSTRYFGHYEDPSGAHYSTTPYPWFYEIDRTDGLHGIGYFKRANFYGLIHEFIELEFNLPSARTYVSGFMNYEFGYAIGGDMTRKFAIDYATISNICNYNDG